MHKLNTEGRWEMVLRDAGLWDKCIMETVEEVERGGIPYTLMYMSLPFLSHFVLCSRLCAHAFACLYLEAQDVFFTPVWIRVDMAPKSWREWHSPITAGTGTGGSSSWQYVCNRSLGNFPVWCFPFACILQSPSYQESWQSSVMKALKPNPFPHHMLEGIQAAGPCWVHLQGPESQVNGTKQWPWCIHTKRRLEDLQASVHLTHSSEHQGTYMGMCADDEHGNIYGWCILTHEHI